jgi:hydrogenase nickel incorporation protein HypA/HybF
MHEVSIALSLLDIVEKKCREEGYQRVESVSVRVGKASGVLPEAFSFAWEAVKKDTIARDSRLTLNLIPVGGTCVACGAHFETENTFLTECPFCSSASFQVIQGRELEIVEMEVN